MTRMARLLRLGMACAFACAAFATGATPAGLDRRLDEGVSPAFTSAWLRLEFPTSDDHAFLTAAMRTVAHHQRLAFPTFARQAGETVTLTSPDGGQVSLAAPDSPGYVVINDHVIPYRGRSLKDFVRDTEAALGSSYVAHHGGVWSWLLPRAHATAPVFFVITIAALAIYQTYVGATAPPDPGAHAAARLAEMARLCDAERESAFVAFTESETARALRTLRADDPVDVARRSGPACEIDVARTLTPTPRASDLTILCDNAAQLSRCVDTFRRATP